MEVFEENNYIELEDVFSRINIEYTGIEVCLDNIFKCKQKYILSNFPSKIKDNNKYNQVNVFYQKYVDDEIPKDLFMKFESRIHEFIKTLWIYSKTYVLLLYPPNNLSKIKCDRKFKKKIKRNDFLKKFLKFNKENNSIERMFCINHYDELEDLLTLATREFSGLLIFFEKYNILVYLLGCEGALVSSEEILFSGFIQCVLSNNNLYLWETDESDTLDVSL